MSIPPYQGNDSKNGSPERFNFDIADLADTSSFGTDQVITAFVGESSSSSSSLFSPSSSRRLGDGAWQESSDDGFDEKSSSKVRVKKRHAREFEEEAEEEGLRPTFRMRRAGLRRFASEIDATQRTGSPKSSPLFSRRLPRAPHSQRSRLPERPRRAQVPEWTKKQPMIIFGKFYFGDKEYDLEVIGEGTFHKVFRFTESGTLTIDDRAIPLNSIVFKILIGTVGPNKKESVVRDDSKGHQQLVADGVPVVNVFAEPMTFIDTDNPNNGMFWVIEKMEEEITGDAWKACSSFEQLDGKSKHVLGFAKYWLTRMAVEKREIIFDFRKRNTMMTGDTIKIVDYSCGDGDRSDIKYMIGRYVLDWANGNKTIFNWLISDFPEDMKPAFDQDIQ